MKTICTVTVPAHGYDFKLQLMVFLPGKAESPGDDGVALSPPILIYNPSATVFGYSSQSFYFSMFVLLRTETAYIASCDGFATF